MTWKDCKRMIDAIISLKMGDEMRDHRSDYRTNAPAPDDEPVTKKKSTKKEKVNMIKSMCEFDKEYPRISAMIYLISSSTLAGLMIGLAMSPILSTTDMRRPFEAVCWTLGISFAILSAGSLVSLVSRAEAA